MHDADRIVCNLRRVLHVILARIIVDGSQETIL